MSREHAVRDEINRLEREVARLERELEKGCAFIFELTDIAETALGESGWTWPENGEEDEKAHLMTVAREWAE